MENEEDVEAWEYFEEMLAKLDSASILDEISNYFTSYGDEDWSDSGHHSMSWATEEIMKSLTIDLKEAFSLWISDVDDSINIESSNKLLSINKNSKFLSFNYTTTLLSYDVPFNKINFIHGGIISEKYEIIIGHGRDPKSIYSLNKNVDTDNIDPRLYEVNIIIDEYFSENFKNTAEIINLNSDFFLELKDIEKIYVLGHSLANVDRLYFKEILKNTKKSVKWCISFYQQEDIDSLKNATELIGINKDKISFFELHNLTFNND